MTGTKNNDAERLFNDISKAMLEDDGNKLSELLAQETPEEETPTEEVEVGQPEEQEQPDTNPPADEPEAEEVEDGKEDTLSEQDSKDTEGKAGDDPIAALRKEIDELKKAQQAASSQVGRIPSLQRRLAEYDKKLAELRSATSSQPSKKLPPEAEEALKDLEDTDPALAETIKKAMGVTISSVDQETNAREIQRLQGLRDLEYQEYVAEQKNMLLSKYPNAAEVFASDSWKAWKSEQPKFVLDLATSDDANAVIMALERYKQDMLAKHPELAQPQQPASAQVVDPVKNEQANKLEEERKRQLTKSADVGSKKAPLAGKQPTDPEALFKQFSEQIRKDITGK